MWLAMGIDPIRERNVTRSAKWLKTGFSQEKRRYCRQTNRWEMPLIDVAERQTRYTACSFD